MEIFEANGIDLQGVGRFDTGMIYIQLVVNQVMLRQLQFLTAF